MKLSDIFARLEADFELHEGKTLTYDLIGEEKASRCSEVGAAVEAKLRRLSS